MVWLSRLQYNSTGSDLPPLFESIVLYRRLQLKSGLLHYIIPVFISVSIGTHFSRLSSLAVRYTALRGLEKQSGDSRDGDREADYDAHQRDQEYF